MTMPQINTATLPLWHSLLFIPAHVQRFIESAPKRGADAIILDLEDSVPNEIKPLAREHLKEHVNFLNEQSQDILIRINRDLNNAIADLNTAVIQSVKAIIIPKVIGAEHIRLLEEVISELEFNRHLTPNSIQLIAMIETLEGLHNINAIAQSSSRLIGLALGTEDLSLDGGFTATPENFHYPAQQLVYAAKLANIHAYGFPGSIADYSNIDAFTHYQKTAKSMGFNGAFCIHPSQVEPINNTYAISSDELEQANKIVAAYEEAVKNKRGAVEVDGKMIDAPVVERAMKLISQSNQ